MIYDYCVVGSGIVGLATAMKLLELSPDCQIVIIDKESTAGFHQTGHNSGVIHAGLYYTPGSLKATLCKAGARAMKAFCAANGIPVEHCGKLVVATNETEVARLRDLAGRCKQNEIEIEWIDRAELRRREPSIEGLSAIFSPNTSIVDFRIVAKVMAQQLSDAGVHFQFGVEVDFIEETSGDVSVVNRASGRRWKARHLISCAGLQADRIARLADAPVDFRIVPFRGDYFVLPPEKSRIISHLIYPTPDPSLPFLGIHLTRMVDGTVTVGPNAALAFAREGYGRFSFRPGDAMDSLVYPGVWKVLWRHRRSVVSELANSVLKTIYLRQCQKYCPSLTEADLLPFRSGVRAQAVTRDGALVSDFLFAETARTLHVCNAPSPAATSSLAIGDMIARKCAAKG